MSEQVHETKGYNCRWHDQEMDLNTVCVICLDTEMPGDSSRPGLSTGRHGRPKAFTRVEMHLAALLVGVVVAVIIVMVFLVALLTRTYPIPLA